MHALHDRLRQKAHQGTAEIVNKNAISLKHIICRFTDEKKSLYHLIT
jgi:hypothetical protein